LGKTNPKQKKFPETDQFAGQTEYFSKCIIEGTDPEPDGEEGLRDVRVCEAIKHSMQSNGKLVSLEPMDSRKKRATSDQVYKIAYGKVVKEEELVNTEPPAKK